MSLIGDLADVKIADVMRLFAQGKKTGRLTVTADEQQTVVRFQKGAVVHAHATTGRLQGDEAVLDLFGWKQGQLTFIPEERSVTANVQRSVDQLILEGLRVGEMFHRMTELIASDRVVFQWGAGPAGDDARATLGAKEWRILRLVDGVRDVRELLEASRAPKSELLRTLFELHEAGLVEKVEPARELRVQSQGLFGKDAATLDERVLDEWRKLVRFQRGVLRVEVRSATGRVALLPAEFRAALFRDVHLPRAVLGEIGVREGEDVHVRPVA